MFKVLEYVDILNIFLEKQNLQVAYWGEILFLFLSASKYRI